MSDAEETRVDIGIWLSEARDHVQLHAPEIVGVFDAYAGEARHGRSYLADDLSALAPGAQVLELGAGSLLLSCQLAREGFCVTALEPVGRGFSHFDHLHQLISELAATRGHAVKVLRLPAEQLALQGCVDFAFSINVMEHVEDYAGVIERVAISLKPGGRYRFTCPNYLFPYEPHFNIFTLFSKAMTERLRGAKIFGRADMSDAADLWESLNWITVPGVRRAVRCVSGIRVSFSRDLLVKTVERMATDPQFSARHTGGLRVVLHAILRLRMQAIFAAVPVSLQPVMDCEIVKFVRAGGH